MCTHSCVSVCTDMMLQTFKHSLTYLLIFLQLLYINSLNKKNQRASFFFICMLFLSDIQDLKGFLFLCHKTPMSCIIQLYFIIIALFLSFHVSCFFFFSPPSRFCLQKKALGCHINTRLKGSFLLPLRWSCHRLDPGTQFSILSSLAFNLDYL